MGFGSGSLNTQNELLLRKLKIDRDRHFTQEAIMKKDYCDKIDSLNREMDKVKAENVAYRFLISQAHVSIPGNE